MRERSATRNFAENLNTDANHNDSTENGQRNGQDCFDGRESIRSNGAESGAESRHNRVGSSLKDYLLPLKIFVAMATAARIP